MKAAAITGPGEARVLEQSRPSAHGDLVVVQILIAPMCTEFKHRRSGPPETTLGHEAAGIVVDAGTSSLVRNGDRVAVMPHYGCGRCWLCTAGDYMYCENPRDVLAETGQDYGTATYAQYVLKPDWLLAPIPDDISLQHGALACCGLGPSFTAMERMQVDALDTVLVSGCGPVGLGAIVHGAVRGARVLAIETHPFRAELARKLGAEQVFDPRDADVVEQIRAATRDGRGVDAAVETSGAPGASRTLALSTRRRGQISFVAWGADVDLPPLVPTGLDIHGCWHWNHLTSAPAMWETIRKAGPLLDTMVTDVMDLDEVSAAMDLQDTGNCGKIFLLPHGDSEHL
ncbi:zinc-binding dehydrogenase [Amnibacterium sp. CER49]|uniref:zinc-dependent alcohol dehydrogenase n=1 Tax=Amnibacterium sp. CER49 TaxID=3039161 RepID=UPI0024488AF3|nr:zinc-binding dehydrogenase [Amnibacterium sp. CER49]MDH2443329.1 zinc-binding dehydrogenase [Amnibacterium sp. CER49]